MFHFIGGIAGLAITIAATVFGFWQARRFTENRLRFVDGVHRATAPIIAGVVAACVAVPITWLLPLVGTGTAVLFGAGVGLGVSSGAKQIRKRLSPG